MRERGIQLPWGADEEEPESEERRRSGACPPQINHDLDVAACARRSGRMDCHKTQRQDMGWLLDLPADLQARASRRRLRAERVAGPGGPGRLPGDIGLRLTGARTMRACQTEPSASMRPSTATWSGRRARAPGARRSAATDRQLPNARMQIAPEEGAFLAMLVRLLPARRILEVGTFTGYSSTAMALAQAGDGRIICLTSAANGPISPGAPGPMPASPIASSSAWPGRRDAGRAAGRGAGRPVRPGVHRCRQGQLRRLLRARLQLVRPAA